MGVGIKNFRYGMGTLNDLRTRIEKQIETYLPIYSSMNVDLIQLPDHSCNIEITIDDITYVYASDTAPVPITLSDIQLNHTIFLF